MIEMVVNFSGQPSKVHLPMEELNAMYLQKNTIAGAIRFEQS